MFDPSGALEGMGAGKSYVDMSTVDAETSAKISEAVIAAGARFLEAPVSGSKKPAIDGMHTGLVLLFTYLGAPPLYITTTRKNAIKSKSAFCIA